MARRAARAVAADLLLEIGTEDLPARFVLPLSGALAGFREALATAGVACGEARVFATPRRLGVHVKAVAPRQTDRDVVRKGPKLAAAMKDGAPTKAGAGFARSCGVTFDALAEEGGQMVFRTTEKGRTLAEVAPEAFDVVLKQMDALVPKRMRWGSGEDTFVRPVRWLTCLHGAQVIRLERFGLRSSNRTYGHRFHAPRAIALKSPAEYGRRLKAARVIADFDARRAMVLKQVETEAKKLKGRARVTDDLLDEVTALVEWPVAIHGGMEERFMALPPEVIIATIEHNQRYFPVLGREGQLLPHFITVANLKSKSVKQVIAGNERVVRPRLADALFFWEQDRKRGLADHLPGLEKITFQKELGSVADKARRVTELAVAIGRKVGEDEAVVRRAAELCKADLVTRMVFEIPELQGVMGGHYARAAGEPEPVANAIAEQYWPVQAGGDIPVTGPGRVLALADKLDTLAGIFAVGLKPTGSKDPYALRRAALGVLRICVEGELDLDLGDLLDEVSGVLSVRHDAVSLKSGVVGFLMERLRGLAIERGHRIESFHAVAATGVTRPMDLMRRLEAVRAFLKMREAESLSAAHKRVRNILKQAEDAGASDVDDSALTQKAEQVLLESVRHLGRRVADAAAAGRYAEGLRQLAKLRDPVDAFFDQVMVMDEDPDVRANRLALLRRLDALCRRIADLSCLPG